MHRVRNARHAYYANVSYFDSKVGQVVATLKEAGQYDNTIVVVTADHGDMLGERGLWYKMNFFEHSARVPLIIRGPGVAPGVCDEPVSLVDLYPTFVVAGQSGEGLDDGFATPLDGQSLWPALHRDRASTDTAFAGQVFAEYCAECAGHPMLMIRREHYKYIHCDGDPPQLFDVVADPMERDNLAALPNHAPIAAAFAAEVASRWDSEQIRQDVLATQRQRRAVQRAMETGALTSWDYQPVRDASQEFVRNHIEWAELAEVARFPRFAEREDP